MQATILIRLDKACMKSSAGHGVLVVGALVVASCSLHESSLVMLCSLRDVQKLHLLRLIFNVHSEHKATLHSVTTLY